MSDDNNLAPAGNVEPTSLSIGDAQGKLETFFSGEEADEAASQPENRPAKAEKPEAEPEDEPIPSYEDDDDNVEPDAADVEEGEEALDDDEDNADDTADAPPEETRLDAVVTLPDGTKATVEDLIKGNLRDADYRQKTEKLSQERRSVQSEYKQVAERGQTLAKLVNMVDSIINQAIPPAPDPALRHEDPAAYADAFTAHQSAQEALDAFRKESSPMLQAADQANKDLLTQHRNEQYRLMLMNNPKFAEKKHMERFVSASMAALSEAGYQPDEIVESLVNDHRIVPVVEGYLNWQNYLKRRAPAAEKAKGKPAPAQRQRVGQQGGGVSRQAKREFQAKPTLNNAAALIERLI